MPRTGARGPPNKGKRVLISELRRDGKTRDGSKGPVRGPAPTNAVAPKAWWRITEAIKQCSRAIEANGFSGWNLDFWLDIRPDTSQIHGHVSAVFQLDIQLDIWPGPGKAQKKAWVFLNFDFDNRCKPWFAGRSKEIDGIVTLSLKVVPSHTVETRVCGFFWYPGSRNLSMSTSVSVY